MAVVPAQDLSLEIDGDPWENAAAMGVPGQAPASERLSELQQVTDAALAYLSPEQLLQELLQRITEILDADTAAVLLLDPGEKVLVARAARGIEEEVERGVRIPLGKGFAGRIAAERRPIIIDDVDHAEILNPILREKGIRSLVGVPLLIGGRVLGVLHVGTLTGRAFSPDDAALLQLAADRAALAIEHAQLQHERRLAQTLQRSLLPARLPAIPGIALATRYMPATEVGGDWYDAFLLPDGSIVLAIGDVMGRGVPAAASMAQLRAAVRAYVLPASTDGVTTLGDVGAGLNRLLAHTARDQIATLACLVLDTETAAVRLVSAGHLPPLLISPGGEARYLPLHGSPPLGLTGWTSYHEEGFALPVGSTLLLYTDGVVEVRGEGLDEGLERLRQAVASGPLEPEQICERVVRAVPQGEHSDDVALLAIRVLPLGAEVRTRWPAEPESLPQIRRLLRRWLRERGADEGEVSEITVASQEACTNAIKHAHGPETADFALDMRDAENELTIAVRDQGRRQNRRRVAGSRGMVLIRAFVDTVEATSGPDRVGTTVELRRRLTRPSAV